MESERGYSPEQESARETNEQRLSKRLRDAGDLDAEGVSEQEKDAFLEMKIAEVAEKLAQLDRVRRHLDQLAEGRKLSAGNANFSPQEKAWFGEGKDANRVALASSWEEGMSLDVEDISAEEKLAFIEEKLPQLRAAAAEGRITDAEERLKRLELLREQYANQSKDERGEAAA